jgi:hypothetical protein
MPNYQPKTDTPTLDLGDLTLALPDPNIELALQAWSASKPRTHKIVSSSEKSDSGSKMTTQSLDQSIRNSPIVIPKPLHPTSAQVKPITMATEMIQITHTAEQPGDGGPSAIGTAISMSMAQQIHQSLQQSMQ